ncbi:two-component sensor histidine kinase [Richelia intracellularis]|nr:two-component sensor histidine kinase [Richelia intracellularis]
MFQATHRRLALWYTAVTALLLLLFASGVYLYVRSTLIERIDDTLNHVAEVVERSLVIEAVNSSSDKLRINVEASFRDNADTVEDDHIDLEWFSATGELLWSTLSEPLNIPIHTNHTGETVHILREQQEEWDDSPLLLRQVTQRVEVGRQILGYLRVSHPWFEVTKPSRQLILDLAVGTGLMVLSVGTSGWFLSGKAMEPVYDSYQRLKQFTADASHELRSPIALIQTNVQVALTDLEFPEAQGANSANYRQQLKLVERLTKRLGILVNDLLFLARQDNRSASKEFNPCPMDALLMEVVEEQQLLAKEKHIHLSLQLIDPPPSVKEPELVENWFTCKGNWDQLARLFTNLISNALHYTPNGGKVSVEVAQIESNHRVSGLRHSHHQLQIKVRDTGIGIPAGALPKLFDRFYRLDPARTHSPRDKVTENTTGSGLGLAIAQAIVENHHGQIQVESTLGQSSTFMVMLPVGKDL